MAKTHSGGIVKLVTEENAEEWEKQYIGDLFIGGEIVLSTNNSILSFKGGYYKLHSPVNFIFKDKVAQRVVCTDVTGLEVELSLNLPKLTKANHNILVDFLCDQLVEDVTEKPNLIVATHFVYPKGSEEPQMSTFLAKEDREALIKALRK